MISDRRCCWWLGVQSILCHDRMIIWLFEGDAVGLMTNQNLPSSPSARSTQEGVAVMS